VLPQHVERLRARDFVNQVQTNEELGLAAWQHSYGVRIPDLLEKCFSHIKLA